MSNEIQKSIYLSVTKSGQTNTLSHANHNITMAGDEMISNVQTIGESAWELVSFGDCASIGECALKNLDATNFIELALDDAGASKIAKLLASRSACIPFSSTTIYAKADTAACKLSVVACEL